MERPGQPKNVVAVRLAAVPETTSGGTSAPPLAIGTLRGNDLCGDAYTLKYLVASCGLVMPDRCVEINRLADLGTAL